METKCFTVNVHRAVEQKIEEEFWCMTDRLIYGLIAACMVAVILFICVGWVEIPSETVETLTAHPVAIEAVRNRKITEERFASKFDGKSETDLEKNEPNPNNTPLTDEEYDVLLYACKENRIDPSLALGLIEVESNFLADAISPHGSYGYCQINPKWHPANLNHIENIQYGITYLADCINRYDNLEAGLTAYSAGRDTGNRTYANLVLAATEKWRNENG